MAEQGFTTQHSPERQAAGLITMLTALYVLVSVYTQGLTIAIKSETGGLEIASAIIPMTMAIGLFWNGALRGRFWMVPVFFLLFALRELDFHNWFFEPGLLQTEIFGSAAPLWQQAVSAALMAFILLTGVLLALRGAGPLLAALRGREVWAWLLVAAVGIGALAAGLDGPDRTAASLGLSLDPAVKSAIEMVEEVIELVFALMLAWAVALWFESHPQFSRAAQG